MYLPVKSYFFPSVWVYVTFSSISFRLSRVKPFSCSTVFFSFLFFLSPYDNGADLLQWPLKISPCQCRNDRRKDLHRTYKRQHTNKQVIRYSIHTKVVPFSGEEEGNEQRNKQKEKERNTDINNKQTSIEIKFELLQSHPAASPSSFPIFQNNVHSIITTCQHFGNMVGLGWSVCPVRCTEQPQNCSACFETMVKQLSLCYAGLQACKLSNETVTQTVIILQETYLLSAVLSHNILVTKICTNQQPTNWRKLSHTKSSFGLDQTERKNKTKNDLY